MSSDPAILSAAEEAAKALRWQIGSNALHVLEHVYSVDPFPGARWAARGCQGHLAEGALDGRTGRPGGCRSAWGGPRQGRRPPRSRRRASPPRPAGALWDAQHWGLQVIQTSDLVS